MNGKNQEKENNALSSVGRALSILECFNRDAVRLSLADIAKQTGFYKSAILRLLKDLQEFDYIQCDMEARNEALRIAQEEILKQGLHFAPNQPIY